MCDENDNCAITEPLLFPVRRFARPPAGLRFSLWTRLICIVVICAALAMLVPLIRYAADGKKWVRCHSNLAQIGLALHNYQDVYGSLPPAYLTDKTGAPVLSWRVLILPYLERDDLYRQIKLDEPWDSPHNIQLAPLMPVVYRCPADAADHEGETSYVAVTGPETLWPGVQSRQLSDARDTSETILLVEAAGLRISWMEPRDLPFDVAADVARDTKPGIAFRHPCGGQDESIQGVFQGHRPNVFGHRVFGANCAFADGSAHAVSEDIAPTRMRELLTVRQAGVEDRRCTNYVMLIDDRPGKPNGPPNRPGSVPVFFGHRRGALHVTWPVTVQVVALVVIFSFVPKRYWSRMSPEA